MKMQWIDTPNGKALLHVPPKKIKRHRWQKGFWCRFIATVRYNKENGCYDVDVSVGGSPTLEGAMRLAESRAALFSSHHEPTP